MALSTDNQNDQIDQALDILEQVQLDHFTASPTSIGPFGASTLSWKVTGPAGFHVELGNSTVGKTGQRTVQPVGTTSFVLTAVAFTVRKVLGQVTVQVVTSGCQTSGLVNPRSTIEGALRVGVENTKGVSFRGGNDLVASFSPGRIRFQMKLSKSVDNFPDPDVDIDVSFGLTVSDGALVPVAEQISVDVSVPWWAWLIPGAPIGLAIAIDMGRDDAKKQMHEAVAGLAQLLTFLAVFPQGLQLRTVRIDKDETGNNGIIEFTACPNKLLVDFSKISEAVVLE